MVWRGGDRISYQIIWVLIFSMIAFTIAMWMLFSFAYNYAINGVMNEYVLTSASELASEVRLLVNADVAELRNLAGSQVTGEMEPAMLGLELVRFVNKDSSPFVSAYVLDGGGRVVAYDSSGRGDEDTFGRVALPKDTRARVLSGETYVAGTTPDMGVRGFWVAAVPVRDSGGKAVGILVGLADVGHIQDIVATKRLGDTGAAYVVDSQGHVLASMDRGHTGHPSFTPKVAGGAAVITASENGVTTSVSGGTRVISAHAALPDTGWGALVRMDEQELLAGYHRTTTAVIFGAILFLGVLVWISIRQINRILAPLSDLRGAAEKVGAGDYGIRVRVDGTDEIGALASTFNSMVSRVREAERAKTEFISLASHELRTPLTSIKGFASTLLRRDVVWDEEIRQDFLQTINSEADRLGRLVSDMLDVSRIDLGRLEFRVEDLGVADMARGVARRVATTTERHRFFFEIPEGLPDAVGDRDRVEQVLHNLYSNAIKYSPSGGSINTTVRLSRDRRFVRIAISDQGIGIPEDKLSMLFVKFYRVRDSRVSETGGTGLGLYITKNLVTAMGGTLEVESTHTKGSTFTFTLPVAPRSRVPSEGLPPSTTTHGV